MTEPLDFTRAVVVTPKRLTRPERKAVEMLVDEVAARSRIRWPVRHEDRKSTRLNSSHSQISYAVFCLKKKNNDTNNHNVYFVNTFETVITPTTCASQLSYIHEEFYKTRITSSDDRRPLQAVIEIPPTY